MIMLKKIIGKKYSLLLRAIVSDVLYKLNVTVTATHPER